jgi:hypothetical protein
VLWAAIRIELPGRSADFRCTFLHSACKAGEARALESQRKDSSNMKRITHFIAASALAWLLFAPIASAQLFISGKVFGEFAPLNPGDRGFDYTTITNTPSGSLFASGAEYLGGGQTSLNFSHQLFSAVGHGGTIAVNFLDVFNAPTLVGTTADTASLDLMIDLSLPNLAPFKLTTVVFGIDNTLNIDGNVADLFLFTFSPLKQIQIADTLVSFHTSFPSSFGTFPGQQVAEGSGATTGLITVSFTPIPEPSTYGLVAAALLAVVAGNRRTRRPQAGAPAIT